MCARMCESPRRDIKRVWVRPARATLDGGAGIASIQHQGGMLEGDVTPAIIDRGAATPNDGRPLN